MNKRINYFLLTTVVLFASIMSSFADQPPNPGGGPGGGDEPVGGGAPIGGGLLILLTMAIGYGIKRFNELRKDS
ncbi:MAG: hypothetical protein R2764_01795 [Bacteroidales bacterium]